MRISQKQSPKPGWGYLLLSFAIPFVGMMIVMLVCGYRPFGSGRAMLYSDCYHQYYPFFAAFRRALRSGDSLLYSWDVGMGVDYLGLVAYYLGSPLNLFSALLPEGQVLNYFCLLVPIKLGLASLFFSLFLQGVFRRDDCSAAFFGGFYGLCAWALGYQWNIMWLDSFALLPLVMLGMVQLLRDRKFLLYTVSLFLAVFSNYYIGLFVCFFVFLTFFCYEICCFQGWKRFFGDLIRIGVFSVLGIGMTAVLFLSSMAALQTTQSSVNKFPTSFRLNIVGKHTVLGLLDGMRIVAGNMGGGLEPTFKEGLPNLYCGVGSIALGFLFLTCGEVKLRDKLCSLFLLLFFNVSFLIRQLDYIWHGFHFPNMIPYRFSFLYSFVLLYMAYRAWILRKKLDPLQILAAFFLSAAVLCCSRDLTQTQRASLWGFSAEVPVYIIYNAGFLLAYTAALLWGSLKPRLREQTEEELLRVKRLIRRRRRKSRTALLILMAVELGATVTSFGCFFPGTSVSNYPKGTEEAASMIRYMHEREKDTLFYRAETTHSQTLNDGALNGYSGISAFTSSANVHITEFMRALGYGAKNTYNRYCFEESSPVANLFLGLKYMIERDGRDRNSDCFSEVHHFGNVALYRNEAYLPLGFLAEHTLETVDFLESGSSFAFQNELFRAATGLDGEVFRQIGSEYVDVYGTGVTVSEMSSGGECSYSDPEAGSHLVYSYVVSRDGFACVRLDLPKRNDFYVSVNGTELYRETISLPQMLAIGDVHSGDIVDIRILCKERENGTANVNVAVMDNDLFWEGYGRLKKSVLELTKFSNTLVEGTVSCDRDGLLYTSIPQNGNWKVIADGEEATITLIGDCMIGVKLSAGEHRLQFVYENAAFRLGWRISVGCGLLLMLLTALSCLRKKPEETPAEEKPESEKIAMPLLFSDVQELLPKPDEPTVPEEPTVPDESAVSDEPTALDESAAPDEPTAEENE